ncbi:tyrosine-protein phosphatase [Nocardia jiangxiensis]|uniref:Tyrosine-protein phosphatase n=1 Tax=Nocardia jiangxiensis TaxID=282685 RepID=A0ABW6S8P5_9NOCA|nr:tyrosine-protein phosphatase [Nocardia jiangxiensis]
MDAEAGSDPTTVVNARDLGRLPLAAGGETRCGVLLRSDAPYVGDSPPTGLTWPPSTVVDLRDSAEAGRLLVAWPDTVRWVGNPVFSGARMDRLIQANVVDLYADMVRGSASRLVGALNQFDNGGSTLVHCAAGKDRTGVVIAIALLLAGVETDAIIADYQRTGNAIAEIFARMQSRGRLPAGAAVTDPVFRTPREAVELVIDHVGGGSDGAWAWVEKNGGDVQRLARWVTLFTGDAAA